VQEQIEDMRAGGTSLTEIASKLKLKSRTIDAIDARGRTDNDELINDIPESSSVLRQAFQTEVGAQASPLDIGQTGLVWYEVLSIEPARDRTFDEVKDRVTKDWTVAEQQRLLTAKAEEIQEKVNSGQKLGALALEMDTLEETTGFTKRSAEFPDFKRTSVQAGFEVKLNTATTAPVAGKEEYLVIVPTESKGTSSAEVKITDEQVQVANGGAGDDMLNQLINNLRNRFEVTQNPAVASQLIQQYN
jgi:peptidyl-prolyl cis-trans isomerase D